MRFLVMVKMDYATEQKAAANVRKADLAAMGRFNDSLRAAGVLQTVDGLLPSNQGAARVTYGQDGPVVKDGPFTESKELVAGFWIIDVKSKAEAVEWTRKVPFTNGESVEIRQIATMDDLKDAK